MDRTAPEDPGDRIEPLEPIDRIEPLDPMLSSDPAEPAAEVARLVCMITFSHGRLGTEPAAHAPGYAGPRPHVNPAARDLAALTRHSCARPRAVMIMTGSTA